MPVTSDALRGYLEESVQQVASARAIWDKATKENRQPTAQEDAEATKHLDKAKELKEKYKKEKAELDRSVNLQNRLQQAEDELNDPILQRHITNNQTTNNTNRDDDNHLVRDMSWTARPINSQIPGIRRQWNRVTRTPSNASQFLRAINTNARYTPDFSAQQDHMNAAFRISDESRGGYFVAPEEFFSGIIQNVDDMVHVQRMSRVFNITAQSLSAIKRISKATMIGWGNELTNASTNKEAGLKFGKRRLTPHYLVGELQESFDLMQSADIDITSYIQGQMTLNISEFLEPVFLTGDGIAKPIGLFYAGTADEGAIPTTRDTATNSTSSAFTFESFISAKYMLKEQYRRKAVWMLHRDMIGAAAKLKGTEQGYLWRPSMIVGEPDSILGLPVVESEWTPNTVGSGLYWGILGDFSNYWIVYNKALQIRPLDQIEARSNIMVWNYRLKVDAMPMLDEAFVRMKYA